ncbi:hypothetical protein RE628_02745 [Paenibacillus sp. D2_2]|uniref:hypothetical protein n=1 Tax=Paenibacillus sp. D2_2 TaxID=3073092 RepID=UPI00281537D8|nr:hypothetical protein [Paenibacillus sp. D2_2]WMT41478.1 hypothetical protein RE628_02745 [Paenibacillus sp. D2_2]
MPRGLRKSLLAVQGTLELREVCGKKTQFNCGKTQMGFRCKTGKYRLLLGQEGQHERNSKVIAVILLYHEASVSLYSEWTIN